MSLGTPGAHALVCYQGEDVTHNWEVESSLIADITGWTIVQTIKDSDTAPTFTKTINGTVTDGPNRLAQTINPAATSSTVKAGTHKNDLWRTGSGVNWLLDDGTYTFKTSRRVTPA